MGQNGLNHLFTSPQQIALGHLRPHISILESIAGSTEAEFLRIGETLQGIYQQANDISGAASEIAGKISESAMRDVREGFNRMSSLMENAGGMQSEKDTVAEILHHFFSLEQPLVSFEKVVRNLNVLCNYIKIEIARLGLTDTSFQKLAEDVQRLAVMIAQKMEALTEQARQAVESLNRNLAQLQHGEAQQKIQGGRILEQINHDLSILAEQNDASARTIQDLSATWTDISRHIGEVVSSLQFHDITRQRVEHVCHALDELPQQIGASGYIGRIQRSCASLIRRFGKEVSVAKADEPPSGEVIADLFLLQAAQLHHADEDLTAAVERILASLQRVSGNVSVMSEKILSVTGGKRGAKESFVARLEKDIGDLTAQANEVAGIKREVASAMSGLADQAMGMNVFVSGMEKISIEMQRLALNARVHAAHIGDEGATLGVLADSIHHLSTGTAAMVTRVTGHLEGAVTSAASLSRMAGADSDLGADRMKTIHETFSEMLSALRGMETDIGESLPRIEAAGLSLAAEIDQLADGIGIHRRVHADLAGVMAYLGASAEKLAGHQPEKNRRRKTLHLEALSAKYTMHSERKTHMASLGVTLVEKPPAKVVAPDVSSEPGQAGQDEGLGDNVELF
ncbi:MAG: hypothetical protein R6W75_08425 [Smithellaceae bacterium]